VTKPAHPRHIRTTARSNQNLMPALIDGALANCTVGEMVQTMADFYWRAGVVSERSTL